MTNITASELKATVENRRRLALRNPVLPDKLEVPSNINSPLIKPPTFVVLDTPNNINASPPKVLTASHIQAGKSTAIMAFRIQEGEDVGHVRFHFWWQNLGSKPVSLANITSRLVINGLWEVDAACSYIAPNVNNIYLWSLAALSIVQFWNQPPTSPPVEDDQ